MEIIKADDYVLPFDEILLHNTLGRNKYINSIFIIADLVDGKTNASVTLIDINDNRDIPNEQGEIRLSGKYILKVDTESEWGEPSEYDRHNEATNWGQKSGFSNQHIPSLLYHGKEKDKYVMIYDVAGMAQYKLVSYDKFGNAPETCRSVFLQLINNFNRGYKREQKQSAKTILQAWLGYRLEPGSISRLTEFSTKLTNGQAAFVNGGSIYIDPVEFCLNPKISENSNWTTFIGFLHGDLHKGNVLFDISNELSNNFWIIDWALSKSGYLFYDECYFEVSLFVSALENTVQQLKSLLDEFSDIRTEKKPATFLPTHTTLVNTIEVIRASTRFWQTANEKSHVDNIEHQWLLAQIAAGLNWVNKKISDNQRKIAFLYAADAATKLVKKYYSDIYNEAVSELSNEKKAKSEAIDWDDVWNQLGRFDDKEFSYLLVTDKLSGIRSAASLSFIPWTIILDMDPDSDQQGMHSIMEAELRKKRSVSIFGKELKQINFNNGTAWMMAKGWNRLHEGEMLFDNWRRKYLGIIGELLTLLKEDQSPKKLKVLLIYNNIIEYKFFLKIAERIDEAYDGNVDFVLIGSDSEQVDSDTIIKQQLKYPAEVFLSGLENKFGLSENNAESFIPGLTEKVMVSPEKLRNWEEDFEILHSSILSQDSKQNQDNSSFYRGMPPSWMDLEAQLDTERIITKKLKNEIEKNFIDKRTFSIILQHSPGAGGTTVARRIAWSMKRSRPVLILKRYGRLTADKIDDVYQNSQLPVLLIAEASNLTETEKSSLIKELNKRFAKIGILYIVRTSKLDGGAFSIIDPMNEATELQCFVNTYLPLCKDNTKRSKIKQLGDNRRNEYNQLKSPFFFGLITFEENFLSITKYVQTHLINITETRRKAILFISLVTRFSQQGIPEGIFRNLFYPTLVGKINYTETLGTELDRLVVHSNGILKIIHPILAENILQLLLRGDWKEELVQVCIDFIIKIVDIAGPDSEISQSLFAQLFINRESWKDENSSRPQFSALIEMIPSITGQQLILKKLTEQCPKEPHFWNHLGRHLIYREKANYEDAEVYLEKAVDLSKEGDPLHLHALGLVRLMWAKQVRDKAFREKKNISAEKIFHLMHNLVDDALDAFEKARKKDPESEYGYITAIQTVAVMGESLAKAGKKTINELGNGNDEIAQWIQHWFPEADSLLHRIKHFRGHRQPASQRETQCIIKLDKLYGDLDKLIETWEPTINLNSTNQSWLRRAVAYAYLARQNRDWHLLSQKELRRIKELAESNLSFDSTNGRDIKLWFDAYRRLPEFSYLDAIHHLRLWADKNDSVDAHYYLYILHFLRWQSGQELSQELIIKHIKLSSERAVGRRDISYEWLGKSPDWCPILNSHELGKWSEQNNFFRDISKLSYTEGTIVSIQRTIAKIKIGSELYAFFIPSSKIRESQHIYWRVRFVLGFSYERLNAWLVELIGPDETY